jgi:hypothetical protein
VIATDDPVSEIIAKTIESLRRLNELKKRPEPFVAEEQTNLSGNLPGTWPSG